MRISIRIFKPEVRGGGRAQVEHLPFIARHIVFHYTFHLPFPFIDLIAGNVAEADVLVVYLR